MKQCHSTFVQTRFLALVLGGVLFWVVGCNLVISPPASGTLPPPSPGAELPAAAAGQSVAAEQVGQIVRQALRQQVQTGADPVEIVAVVPQEFADACLGAPTAGELCAQVITPGYVVTLVTNGAEYRFHTNETASEIRRVAAPTPEESATTSAYQPGDPAACRTLRDDVAQVLSVEATLVAEPAAFESLPEELGGTSCLITATGTGEDFPNFVDVVNDLVQLLEGQGWSRDPLYVADSPTSTIVGLRQANQLAVIAVDWSPAPEVTCPPDEPIATCAEQLEPQQMVYTITVDLAQRT